MVMRPTPPARQRRRRRHDESTVPMLSKRNPTEEVCMKLAHARIVTNDVPGLTRFYQQVTGMAPVGDDRYVEFNAPALTLAISSQRMIDVHSAGAATPRANRSVILDFEVDDVDEE